MIRNALDFFLKPVVFILVTVHPLLCVQQLSLESAETILKVLLAVIFYFSSPSFFSQSWAVAVSNTPALSGSVFPAVLHLNWKEKRAAMAGFGFLWLFVLVPLKPEQLPQPTLLYPLEAASRSLCMGLPGLRQWPTEPWGFHAEMSHWCWAHTLGKCTASVEHLPAKGEEIHPSLSYFLPIVLAWCGVGYYGFVK